MAGLLGSVVRWRMLYIMAREERVAVSHLAAKLGISRPTLCMHMALLKRAGIVEQGLGRLYSLTPRYRPAPGAEFIDLGLCRLMFPAAAE